MRKKLMVAVSLALVVVVLVVVLVACSQAGQQEQEPQNLRQEVQQTETVTPEPTVEPTVEPTTEPPVEPTVGPEPEYTDFAGPFFAGADLQVYREPDTASEVMGQISKDSFVSYMVAINSDGWAKVDDVIADNGIISGYVLFDQLLTADEFNQQQQPEPESTPEPEVTPEPTSTPEPTNTPTPSQQPSGGTGGTSGGTTQQPQGGGTSGNSGGGASGGGERPMTPEELEEAQRLAREWDRQIKIANGLDPDATQPVNTEGGLLEDFGMN